MWYSSIQVKVTGGVARTMGLGANIKVCTEKIVVRRGT